LVIMPELVVEWCWISSASFGVLCGGNHDKTNPTSDLAEAHRAELSQCVSWDQTTSRRASSAGCGTSVWTKRQSLSSLRRGLCSQIGRCPTTLCGRIRHSQTRYRKNFEPSILPLPDHIADAQLVDEAFYEHLVWLYLRWENAK